MLVVEPERFHVITHATLSPETDSGTALRKWKYKQRLSQCFGTRESHPVTPLDTAAWYDYESHDSYASRLLLALKGNQSKLASILAQSDGGKFSLGQEVSIKLCLRETIEAIIDVEVSLLHGRMYTQISTIKNSIQAGNDEEVKKHTEAWMGLLSDSMVVLAEQGKIINSKSGTFMQSAGCGLLGTAPAAAASEPVEVSERIEELMERGELLQTRASSVTQALGHKMTQLAWEKSEKEEAERLAEEKTEKEKLAAESSQGQNDSSEAEAGSSTGSSSEVSLIGQLDMFPSASPGIRGAGFCMNPSPSQPKPSDFPPALPGSAPRLPSGARGGP